MWLLSWPLVKSGRRERFSYMFVFPVPEHLTQGKLGGRTNSDVTVTRRGTHVHHVAGHVRAAAKFSPPWAG